MLKKKIKILIKKSSPIFWTLIAILLGSLVFSIFGYAFGSPLHDWLSLRMTDIAAITYFIALPLLLVIIAVVDNLLVSYSSLILFLWLSAFWKVASVTTPRLSTAIGVVIFIIMILALFRKDEENVA